MRITTAPNTVYSHFSAMRIDIDCLIHLRRRKFEFRYLQFDVAFVGDVTEPLLAKLRRQPTNLHPACGTSLSPMNKQTHGVSRDPAIESDHAGPRPRG